MSLSLRPFALSEDLLDQLCRDLVDTQTAASSTKGELPRPIPVLVPSAQLGDWLKTRIARKLGLSMGFEFLLAEDYLSRRNAPGDFWEKLSSSHAFWSSDSLRWHILPLIGPCAGHLGHDSRKPLLPRDQFAFAQLLAQQLDRYARHRPSWPGLWAKNQVAWQGKAPKMETADQDESWQRQLWHQLSQLPNAPVHPAQLVSEALIQPKQQQTKHATPLFVIGAGVLDPLLLQTLQLLSSQGHPISLYVLLPSLGYLGDQTRRTALLSLNQETNGEEALELGGHPLLSSLGQEAIGTFLLLDSITPDYKEWPEQASAPSADLDKASLLQRIQADIRAQRTPPGMGSEDRPVLSPADLSLRIHSCHSPRRELEVLRDELLRAFKELPNLKRDEVLIGVTDFDTYAPLAEGILNGGTPSLNVRLTAVPTREANPIAAALLALLQLASGRHSASELVELTNLSAIQQHLGLADDQESLAHLADILRSSGLTHDIDTATRGHTDDTGTWRSALDRHLAGAWFGPIETVQDTDRRYVHPLAPELHYEDQTRLKFIRWLTLLADQQREWLKPASATAWAQRLQATVETLLDSTENDEHSAAVIRLLGELKQVTATTELDAGALIDWLQPKLENATSLRTTMDGNILLGRLEQLNGLPCRVLALLGLQDGAFPRASRRTAWDLLGHSPERWDADLRRHDRQCFLDSLLTPSDRLILSAANRSLRTPHDGPLAACIEELVRTAAATVRSADEALPVGKQLVHLHRIQPFSLDYFQSEAGLPRSFSQTNARIAQHLTTAINLQPAPFFSPTTEASTTENPSAPLSLTITQLIRFWQDPAKGWLSALRVQIDRKEDDDTTLDDAPLELDGLESYEVNDTVLRSHLEARIPEETQALLIADRALPPGALGKLVWDRQNYEIRELSRSVDNFIQETSEPIPLTVKIDPQTELTGSLRIGGTVDPNSKPWILVYRPGKFEKKPRYHLDAFIQTLLAAVHSQQAVGCKICGTDELVTHTIPPIDPESAARHLQSLIVGYRRGQTAPLCYAPASSEKIAANLRSDSADESAALAEASKEWFDEPSSFRPGGEGAEPSAQLVWRDSDPFAAPHDAEWLAWAREIAVPLLDWWEKANDITATTPAKDAQSKPKSKKAQASQ